MTEAPLLQVENLTIVFGNGRAETRAVDGISLSLARGEIAGLAGESGSGKSATAFAILGLLPRGTGRIAGGAVHFEGQDLACARERDLCAVRGRRIAYIPQEPMTALNPTLPIGRQLTLNRRREPRAKIYAAASAQLAAMGFENPGRILRSYPFQLSGGQRQRVLIAAAFLNDPALIIADEPTTALDVTIQAEILSLLTRSARDRGTAVLLITHNLGVAWRYCETLTVMRRGLIVERGAVRDVLTSPNHPYTAALIASLPGSGMPRTMLASGMQGSRP